MNIENSSPIKAQIQWIFGIQLFLLTLGTSNCIRKWGQNLVGVLLKAL